MLKFNKIVEDLAPVTPTPNTTDKSKREFIMASKTSDYEDKKIRAYLAMIDRIRRCITAMEMDLIDPSPDIKNAEKLGEIIIGDLTFNLKLDIE